MTKEKAINPRNTKEFCSEQNRSDYDRAIAEAGKLAASLPGDWQPEVYEDKGWRWRIRLGNWLVFPVRGGRYAAVLMDQIKHGFRSEHEEPRSAMHDTWIKYLKYRRDVIALGECSFDDLFGTHLSEDARLATRLDDKLREAQENAWKSLARYKFLMFGYWCAVWVHLNRLRGGKHANPWIDLVKLAREKP